MNKDTQRGEAALMQISVLGATPYYVLMDGNRRIGPKLVPLDVEFECSPIYGFSDRDPYDRFRLNSQVALTPYPLVKGYLRHQASAPGGGLKLVVVDAAGPREAYLHAATMAAVLEAHEKQMSHVAATYGLVFEQQIEAYRVEEVSV